MILYRARFLVTMDGPPIEDGGMLVCDDEIMAVGKYADLQGLTGGENVDLGEVILMPGLINAHCHLAFSSMRHLIVCQSSFAKWIQRINSAKRNLTDEDYLDATYAGATELLRHGTTTVVNIESFPELLDREPKLPLRTWWCYEMLDIRMRNHSDESMHGALKFFESSKSEMTRYSLSPHAPYTASARLYQLAQQAAQLNDLLLTTHVGESAEEMQMMRDASGPLYEFLKSIGRDMSDCGGTTPLRHLIEHGNLRPENLLVHLNELEDDDYDLMTKWANGDRIHVAHCPKSHQFFRHTPFPYERLSGVHANISLGSDSLASNDKLNLFSEMQNFSVTHPDVSPVEILEMVTRNPALTLRKAAKLGVLRAGAKADAIALNISDVSRNLIYETILHYQEAISWMLVGGKRGGR